MADMKTLTMGGQTYTVRDAESVHFTEQTLTDEQKAQARKNIGVVENGSGGNVLNYSPFGVEINTGCNWIDGKPIYRVVIETGKKTANTTNYDVKMYNN